MSQASDPGAKLIASYRAATRMRPEQRERALRKLRARLSTDPTPSIRPEVPVPELPPPLPAAWVQLRARWRRFATVSKVITGAALLTWLATEPDAHGSVEHDFAARRAPVPLAAAAARPGSNAGAETEPCDPHSTPARSQLATPTHAAARSGRSRELGLSDASERATAVRSGRATERAMSHAPDTPTAVRSGRAPESAVSDAPELGAEDREADQSARASVEDARAARQTRQQLAQRAGGAQLPERGARQLGAASLEQETLLLEQAQAALKRGDAERALHLLAEHTWLFPAGHLAEARDVARILALCQAGHAGQARLRAKSFLAARPHSPFAARVRSSCPDADKPPNAK